MQLLNILIQIPMNSIRTVTPLYDVTGAFPDLVTPLPVLGRSNASLLVDRQHSSEVPGSSTARAADDGRRPSGGRDPLSNVDSKRMSKQPDLARNRGFCQSGKEDLNF